MVAAPPGLIYSDSKGQWKIATDGRPTLIMTATNLLVSPDGQWALYKSCNCGGMETLMNLTTGYTRTLQYGSWEAVWSSDSRYLYYTLNDKNNLADIWAEEVATGKRRNLTNTPDRYEDPPLVWSQNPDVLVFYSTPGIPDGEGWIGFLTIMKTDGTGYKVVSNDGVISPAALSPDGHTIAYVTYETIAHATHTEYVVVPWYYRVGSQPQRFPWKSFGLSNLKDVYFSSPAWSPDGLQLAWRLTHFAQYGVENDKTVTGVAVFDLVRGTSHLWLDFTQEGPQGWNTPSWDAKGKRLLFFGQKDNGASSGLWLGDLQTGKVHLLTSLKSSYNVCDWAWQPDGQWLAISCREHSETLSGIWLAELETGKLLKTNLPDDAQIRGWVNPQP
jgi:Tol biopolymer transport system component